MHKTITTAQERAIKFHKGACLVLAGPGSGKTFVITNRVAHLIQDKHIPDEHILIITFTKAAALEMEQRFHQILPEKRPWFGTFHACFYHILKHSYTSIPNRFITTEEKHHILKSLMDSVLDPESDLEVEEIDKILSLFMNNGLSGKYISEYADLKISHLKTLYAEYHKALVQYGYLDFDDLMLCCYQLLKNNPEIRKKWQEQFQYILVDECQDMNILQYEILKLLSGTNKNIFIVGDDDQSIYRFRGARVELMQRFKQEFSPIELIELDRNFRSTSGIVEAGMKVISKNKNRFEKKIQAELQDKSGVNIQAFELKRDMFQHIFHLFQKEVSSKLHSSAIICRTNQELSSIAYKLRQNNIPYQSREDQKSVFDEEWYLDIEAYFKLGLGSKDRSDILRVANKPNRFIKREQLTQFTYLPAPLEQAVKHIHTMRPFLAIKYIWSGIGYGRWLERKLDHDAEKWDYICEQMEEITLDMKNYASIEDWLEHVAEDRVLQRSIQNVKRTSEKEGVHLLTMHASKGLEFEHVYLLEINKGKMPKGSKLSMEELEEERRLFYVAMTRAKKTLNIYYIGGAKDHTLQPSDFILPILTK